MAAIQEVGVGWGGAVALRDHSQSSEDGKSQTQLFLDTKVCIVEVTFVIGS